MFVKNYHHGGKWLTDVIQKRTGPVSFVVKLIDGRVIVVIKIKSIDTPYPWATL